MNPFKENSNRKMLKLCYLFNIQLTRPCSLELLHQSQQRKLGISSRLNTKDNPSYYSYVAILENRVRDFRPNEEILEYLAKATSIVTQCVAMETRFQTKLWWPVKFDHMVEKIKELKDLILSPLIS